MQIGSQIDHGHLSQIQGGSKYAEELRKHEAQHTVWGPPGRPYEFREYPTMLYKAKRTPQGGEPVFEHAEAGNDVERERLERVGFVHGGKAAALAKLEQQEFEIAELAANRHFTERRMSEQARAEAQAADDATIRHLAEVPETPIKRSPGRPKARPDAE